MKRKAIIIDARKSVRVESQDWNDVTRLRDLLHSATGGAWNQQEVHSIRATTSKDVVDCVRTTADADFSMLVYLGAGTFAKRDRPWSEMEVSLPSGELLGEGDLNSGAPRCLAIFDCTDCYEATEPWLPEEKPRNVLAEAKRQYLECIESTEKGFVRILGRVPSSDSPRTHSLIAGLLRLAKDWRASGTGVLSFDAAIGRINAASQARRQSLTADYLGGRRLHHFPFVTSV